MNLDIEMETGTGKTYVYIKTMFELNKLYGWSKFVVVVPSIAIRAGVAKSFSMLEDHFMEEYHKKARYFIYDTKDLSRLNRFSAEEGIVVMIINTQAFASRSKDSRIIYTNRDEFASIRPIDVIARARPIIIMDEPQKMEGTATKSGLEKFNPLFVLNYSATHKTKHNTIYALDAYDAYRQRLVKRILVQGFEVRNIKGTGGYLYVDEIVLSPENPPIARIEFERKRADGNIQREIKSFSVGDSLFEKSALAQYRDYTISEINPADQGAVTFVNGTVLHCGEAIGDMSEEALQRVQIRQTIYAHLDKEKELFNRGIKCLSLFFIDEVSNYRQYGPDGKEIKGKFQQIFEKEYKQVAEKLVSSDNDAYTEYLRRTLNNPEKIHRGYFSIDQKSGRSIDSKTSRGSDLSDDISAYELILKNKERLLSFDEPTRFIFSHSALREGWDNPNIFQICMLRHSNSSTARRQEVGRGLRLCVNKDGVRQDAEILGEDVHLVNQLTVIANESYANFTAALQQETQEALRFRIAKADQSYFNGKIVSNEAGTSHEITSIEASLIVAYLSQNGYIDGEGRPSTCYYEAAQKNNLATFDSYLGNLEPFRDGVLRLMTRIYNPAAVKGLVSPAPVKTPSNSLNENFKDSRFQMLWNELRRKHTYTVHYDSDELIRNVVRNLTQNLHVPSQKYVMTSGVQSQGDVLTFTREKMETGDLTEDGQSSVSYDLVGEIARGATLTRRSVVNILRGLGSKLSLFKNNPDKFISEVIRTIRSEKASMIVNHITYNPSEATPYDSTIFIPERKLDFNKALSAAKHVTPYVPYDSLGEKSFAESLNNASEVLIFAKIPRRLKIPTPVGDYSPDWAIVLDDSKIKHVFFIAETKGSLDKMELRGVEKAKTECANALFNSLSSSKIRYGVVDRFDHLLEIIDQTP